MDTVLRRDGECGERMLWGSGVLYRPRRRLTTVWSSLADRPLIVMAYIAATGGRFLFCEGKVIQEEHGGDNLSSRG